MLMPFVPDREAICREVKLKSKKVMRFMVLLDHGDLAAVQVSVDDDIVFIFDGFLAVHHRKLTREEWRTIEAHDRLMMMEKKA